MFIDCSLNFTQEHRGEGTQNGEFRGQKYFKCDKDCAVFVSMDKITNSGAAKAAVLTQTATTSAPKPLGEDNNPIRINDHVTFFDISNNLFRGTAKWIGTIKSKDTIIVGIEVVSDNYDDNMIGVLRILLSM